MEDMWPGGDILYLKPLQHTWRFCWSVEHDTEWTAVWADPEDLHTFVMSLRAMELHVPWLYENAVEDVYEAFQDEAAAGARDGACADKGPLLTRTKRFPNV